VEADSDFYKNKRLALESLVNDRNDFYSSPTASVNPNSIESCLEIEQYLDQQRERLIPEHDYLKSLIEGFEEAKKAHIEFLASEEGIRQFELSFLQQSPLVTLLLDVSSQLSRSDGWTPLSVAGQQMRQNLPGQMEQLKNHMGYKSLKNLSWAVNFLK